YGYDAYGNLTSVTAPPRADGTRSQTKFSYPNSAFGSWNTPGVFLKQVDTAFGTGVQQSTAMDYDPWTGVQTSTTDANGVVSTRTLDILGRPIIIQEGNGVRATSKTYSSEKRCVITTTDLDGSGSSRRRVSTVQHFDRLGRLWL